MPTAKELGEQVNELRAKLGQEPLKNPGKKGATALEEELASLQAQVADQEPEFTVVEELDEDALVQPKVPETIKAMSYRLLRHVHRVDPEDNRTVGLLYSSIVALVRKKFPKAETSLECLRWYAVHMRQENIKLPQKRPRPQVRV